jgi:CheY-specific phosphatase CheX
MKKYLFRSLKVFKVVGGKVQTSTRMIEELKNLVTQHTTTGLRKASFALRVTGKCNELPVEQKNSSCSKVFHRMRKRERE